ncbi:MAG: fibronectin type III domain-containing protein, partial [Candidatus Hodarchaeales archaeon]
IPANKPGPVSNLTALSSNNTITLSWSYPINDGGYIVFAYHIFRSITSGSNYVYMGTNDSINGFIDSNLINGQTYYYYVVAETIIGNGTASFEVFETPGAVPSNPSNILISIGNKNISIIWDPSNSNGFSIIEYLIYRSTTSGTGFILIKSIAGDVTSYVDTNLLVGNTYYYYVIAKNIKGDSNPSIEVSAKVATYPDPVTSFNLTIGDRLARLDWIIPVDGGSPLTGFEIYRSLNSSSLYSLIIIVNGTTSSYIDTGLTNGITYYYIIKSKNIIGLSTPSAEKNIKPGSKPGISTNFRGVSGNSKVTLEWDEPNDGGYPIIEYRIYRSQTKGSGYFSIANITNTVYTNTGLTNREQYYYKVLAVNRLGSGPFSSEILVTPSTIPVAPANVSHLEGFGWIIVYWDAPIDDGGSQIIGYNIYRSEGVEKHFDLIATLSFDTFEYNDATITSDSTLIYYYVLTAINSNGESLYSTEIAASSVNKPNTQKTTSKPVPSTTTSEEVNSASLDLFIIVFGIFLVGIKRNIILKRKNRYK